MRFMDSARTQSIATPKALIDSPGRAKSEILLLLALYVFVLMSSILFGSRDLDSVGGGFQVSGSQFLLVGANIGAAVMLLFAYRSSVFLPPTYMIPFLALPLYAGITSLWSTEPLKSGGLALILLINVLWGLCIGRAVSRFSHATRLDMFMLFWLGLLLADAGLKFTFFGFPTNLDETSAILFFLAFICAINKRFVASGLLGFVALSGQSFSAIVSLLSVVGVFIMIRRPIIGLLFLAAAGFAAFETWKLIQAGQLTVYGKDASLLIAGSGRFGAWNTVWAAIVDAPTITQVFGHGYATDRNAMLAAGHSWVVDVHNNVLHILYGLGVLGAGIVFLMLVSAMNRPMLPDFRKFRIAFLVGAMLFGLSSSYFFGRPSLLGIFWISFIIAGSTATLAARSPRR